MEKTVEQLIQKAADSASVLEALHFSQAALNAANALCALDTLRRSKTKQE